MKAISGSLLRSIFAILFGLSLIIWPELAMRYFVIVLGVCFLVPGAMSLLNYATKRSAVRYSNIFLVEAIGSIILGLFLIFTPEVFTKTIMILFAVLLILAGFLQLFKLMTFRKHTEIPFFLYILPSIILLGGFFILLNPIEIATGTFILFGVAALIYGFSEFVNWIKFRKILNKD